MIKPMKGGERMRQKLLNPIMQKKGQGAMIVGIIVLVAIVGLGAWLFFGGLPQAGLAGDQEDCSVDTQITYASVNSILKGTTVTPTHTIKVNGGPPRTYAAADVFKVGDQVETFANNTNFIDVIVPAQALTCGPNQISFEMFATSTNSFRIFNTNGNPLADSTTSNASLGEVVQNASSAAVNLDIRVDSSSDESTGDLVIVIEADNTTQVDDIQLSGLGGATSGTTPEFYSAVVANSIIKTFEIPGVLDGNTVAGTLTISPETGITMGDLTIYVTAYSKQAYQDTDGIFKIGIENEDGTQVNEDTWDFDFCITDEECS